jgi:hypothetical protein
MSRILIVTLIYHRHKPIYLRIMFVTWSSHNSETALLSLSKPCISLHKCIELFHIPWRSPYWKWHITAEVAVQAHQYCYEYDMHTFPNFLYILIFLSRYREFSTIQTKINLASFIFFRIMINAEKIIETLLLQTIRPLLQYSSLCRLFIPPTNGSTYLASPAHQRLYFGCNTKHPDALPIV